MSQQCVPRPIPHPCPLHVAAICLETNPSSLPSACRSNVSRDRGPRALLEACGAVVIRYCLSWRLAPVCSIVIIATAVAAVLYRSHTKSIEQRQSRALQCMTGVAQQALDNIRTVR